jgi:hypothetical protein
MMSAASYRSPLVWTRSFGAQPEPVMIIARGRAVAARPKF